MLANDLKDIELTEAQIITIPEAVDDDALKRLVLDIFFNKTYP
jgi:ribose 5-phosphate isomerase RpiB